MVPELTSRSKPSSGEHAIWSLAGLLLVDSYDPSTHTVFEFHGCLWHGCPRCFKQTRHSTSKIHPDRTLEQVYEATCQKINLLKHLSSMVTEQWECDWDWEVKTDLGLQEFLSTFNLVEPLSPREPFFGGRTNAATLYYKADESQGEQIKYVDVTSLYPWVNKYGHPDMISHPEDQDISKYFVIAKVDMLPPLFHLYHPVFPYRCGGKLVLPLCRSCVEEQMSKPLLERGYQCSHNPTRLVQRGAPQNCKKLSRWDTQWWRYTKSTTSQSRNVGKVSSPTMLTNGWRLNKRVVGIRPGLKVICTNNSM